MSVLFSFFFFNDTATTEIYTLSLHDALPISAETIEFMRKLDVKEIHGYQAALDLLDRKSTRLNSSHTVISYAVFCLKKKKITVKFSTPHSPTHEPTATSNDLL